MSDSAEFPRAWRFSGDGDDVDGPVFLGRFTGEISQGKTSYGDTHIARFVEEATGDEISVWMFNQSLLNNLVELKPDKGELVEITWYGKKKSKSTGRTYQSFKVIAPERPVPVLNWGDLAPIEDEDAEEEE